MKTRTLLLLSVGTALAILLAGGVLLVQLAGRDDATRTVEIGAPVTVGDVTIEVTNASERANGSFGVDVVVGGADDDLDGVRLVTGDRTLEPITAPAADRCTQLTVEPQTCRLDFDVSAAEGPNRVLVLRRGDEQVNWKLSDT